MAFDIFSYAVKRMLAWVRTEDGYHGGVVADPDDVDTSSGSVISSALMIEHIVEAPPPEVTRAIFKEKSGQVVRQILDGGVEDLSPFDITVARITSDLNNLASGVGVNSARMTGVIQGGSQIAAQALRAMGIAFFGQGSKKTVTGYMPSRYMARILPTVTLGEKDVTMTQATGDNPQPVAYTVSPAMSRSHVTGELFSSITGLNYDNGETITHRMSDMDYEFNIETVWLDGTTDPVTLTYLPLFSDVSVNGRNMIAKNGVASGTAITSINTGTGALVPAANSDGDILVLIYPTNFIES